MLGHQERCDIGTVLAYPGKKRIALKPFEEPQCARPNFESLRVHLEFILLVYYPLRQTLVKREEITLHVVLGERLAMTRDGMSMTCLCSDGKGS